MAVETKFLRLYQPATLGEQIDGWKVCWLGGWGKGRLFYLGDGDQGEDLKKRKPVLTGRGTTVTLGANSGGVLTALMDSTDTMQGGRMARIRKGKNPGPVAVRRTVKKRTPGADTGVGNEKPHPVQRVTEFPQSPAADDVVSDRIIFEIGDSRFAIQWTADIERLPPAGPVAVGRKQGLKLDRSPQRRSPLASRK